MRPATILLSPANIARHYRFLMQICTSIANSDESISEKGLHLFLRKRFERGAEIDMEQLENALGLTFDAIEGNSSFDAKEALNTIRTLSMGVGNMGYRRVLEEHFLDLPTFSKEASEHNLAESSANDEHQNQLLRIASKPLLELLIAIQTSPSVEAAKATTAHMQAGSVFFQLRVGSETVVILIDESKNLQTIFIMSDQMRFEELDDEDAEIVAPEALPRCEFRAQALEAAQRILAAMEEETPIHKSRATTLVGFGVAGSFAEIISLLAVDDGFDIRNALSFGAPPVIASISNSLSARLNTLHILLTNDVNAFSQSFAHRDTRLFRAGEVLLLNVPTVSSPPSMVDYLKALNDFSISAEYFQDAHMIG